MKALRPDPTLDQLLEHAAAFPDVGLRFVDRREREEWASWAQILDAARPVAAALWHLGVRPGDRVALVYPTGLEFFHAFFGALLAAAVPVPLEAPVRLGRRDEYHRRTAAMLAAAGARWVLTAHRLQPLLAPTVAAAGARCLDLGELAATPRGAPRRPADAAALALVQFSSGTTVDPKPVALSHRALVAQARILNGFWPDRDGRRHSGVSWLPLHHDMGLIGCVLPALERPGAVTLLAPEVFVARPATWLRALSRYRATISAAPNFAYALCTEKIRDHELDGVNLGAWTIALTGAEPVTPEVLRRFQARFAPWGFRPEALTPVYGLAEASLAVTFSEIGRPFQARRFDRRRLAAGEAHPDAGGLELVAVGAPVPGFTVRIVDDDGRPVPARRLGRVQARGPSLMTGYLGQPAATARVLAGGWLETGDLGFFDGGELYLTGRAKDVVILRGRNHSPLEIERAVAGVAGGRDGAAVAVSYLPEDAATEKLLLFVERARRAGGGDLAALPAACAEAVLAATGLAVGEVHVLEPGTLPRTTSGKLRRQETLRRHLDGTLGASPAAARLPEPPDVSCPAEAECSPLDPPRGTVGLPPRSSQGDGRSPPSIPPGGRRAVSAEHELLIVGGGPAGLATAIAGRLAGFDSAVVDGAAPPIDKACGEGLMPDGLACLQRLGVALAPHQLAPFHGIRYLDGDTVAEGRFPGVSGAGIRRLHLHEALCRRAGEVGVRLLWRRRVRGLVDDGGGVRGVETDAGVLTARWLVGADGLHSHVRRWSGLAGRPARQRRFGVRRHFAVAPWTDLVEVYWADGCEAYVTPVGAEEVGVALLWSGRKARFDELMRAFPALAERLRGAPVTSRDRGAGPLRQRVRAVARGRLALVGDASGYVDAITGEGLALAFRQAEALAAALVRGDLGLYARRHRQIGRWADGLTALLLSVEARPWLRRRVVRALARDPALFGRVLAVHSGAWPVRGLGLGSAPRLLWGLVRP